MGLSYFHEYLPTDAATCNRCDHFEQKMDGGKPRYRCISNGCTSRELKEMSTTTTACPELEVRAESGLDSSSKGKGLAGKLADKAKSELKAAALRDVKTIGRNLGKMI